MHSLAKKEKRRTLAVCSTMYHEWRFYVLLTLEAATGASPYLFFFSYFYVSLPPPLQAV
jgi:hypothetical protein